MAVNPLARVDLPIELYSILDSSGNYVGPWLETSGVYLIRVACASIGGSPSVYIEEAIDPGVAGSGEPKTIRVVGLVITGGYSNLEIKLYSRMYRFVVQNGLPDDPFSVSIRVVV